MYCMHAHIEDMFVTVSDLQHAIRLKFLPPPWLLGWMSWTGNSFRYRVQDRIAHRA